MFSHQHILKASCFYKCQSYFTFVENVTASQESSRMIGLALVFTFALTLRQSYGVGSHLAQWKTKCLALSQGKPKWSILHSESTNGPFVPGLALLGDVPEDSRVHICAHTHSNTMIQEIQSYGKIKSTAGYSCDSGIGQQYFNVHIQIWRQLKGSTDGR